jgi:hypothetical protein
MSDLLSIEELPIMAKPEQVAALLQTTVQALAQDRYAKKGLPYCKIAGRVRYARVDVLRYLEANRYACGATA